MSFPCAGQEFLSSALLFAASPLGLLLWGTALWLLLGRRKRWLAAGLLVFLAACTPLGGKWALRAVESLCPPRSDQKAASVLVLSGGAVFDGVRFTASPASVRRLRFALQQTNGGPILLSGIESPLLLSWLSERKDLREVLIERSSRTTEENFRFSAPAKDERPDGPCDRQVSHGPSRPVGPVLRAGRPVRLRAGAKLRAAGQTAV